MNLGQLIEYNMNIFLENSCIKCGGEVISRPFSKKSKLKISLDQQFVENQNWWKPKRIETEVHITFINTFYNGFL